MNDCPICQSEYKQAIDDMLRAKASYKYIQSWCKERNFKISQQKIKNHLVNHTNFTINSKVDISNIDSIYLKKTEVIEEFNLPDEVFNNWFAETSKKDAYNVIPMMVKSIESLNEELKQVYCELQDATNRDLKNNLETLKVEKLNAQVRFQEGVAKLRHIELQKKKGILVSVKELKEKWSYSKVRFKAKLESIPNKLALRLSSIKDEKEIETILLNEISESLEELKDER